MNILYGILAIVFGIGTFMFANPAGVPVFGLAFAAACLLREFRSKKRKAVISFGILGAVLCVLGTALFLITPEQNIQQPTSIFVAEDGTKYQVLNRQNMLFNGDKMFVVRYLSANYQDEKILEKEFSDLYRIIANNIDPND